MRLAQSHPDWVLCYQDEVWWSRFTKPSRHTWSPDGQPLRLIEEDIPEQEPQKALACYGVLRADTNAMLLRFVEGRPISQVTCDFLEWTAKRLFEDGKTAMLMVWDNASWHISKAVRSWIRAHNRKVKKEGGVRIIAAFLPSKSPWLNKIEPQWVHGKRAIGEPDRPLSKEETIARVFDYYGCQHVEPLIQLKA